LLLPFIPRHKGQEHGEAGVSRHCGINGRGPAAAGKETVYAAKGLDKPDRRTATVLIVAEGALKNFKSETRERFYLLSNG